MDTLTGHEQVDALDPGPFANAIADTAANLAARGHSVIDLSPGDMTNYRIVVVECDGPDQFIVGIVDKGCTYPWGPSNSGFTSPGYAASKWTDDDEWTGAVLSRYLNGLRDVLAVKS
jgi:hypothetical protein